MISTGRLNPITIPLDTGWILIEWTISNLVYLILLCKMSLDYL